MKKDMPAWHGRDGAPLGGGAPFGIMGIINLAPDSFFDGGQYADADRAYQQAEKLLAEGAAILDLGAESTRPGAKPIGAEMEWERLRPALEKISALPAPLSVDTWHASTAVLALEAGAEVINDVSGCLWDPGLVDALAQYKPAYALTHSGGRPRTMQLAPSYDNVLDEVKAFFEERLGALVRAGLPENRIALDPGIGFGKKLEHNLELLANIEEFLSFGRPLLIGLSMKSMFGDLLGLHLGERGCATAAASALLLAKGVFWHRVHEPGSVRQALLLADALENFKKGKSPAMENAMRG